MSILLALIALGQTSPVTYRAAAQPLDRLLMELSSKTGVQMRASGRIAEDVVLVSVKEVPLAELRDKIAAATTGSWRQDGDRLILERNEAKARQEAQTELGRVAERYAKAITEYTKPMSDASALTADEAERRLKKLAELNDRIKQGVAAGNPVGVEPGGTPGERLIVRTLRAVNPADLASLPSDSRTVFSTAPNRMQRPLSNAATKALQTFASEYAVWQSIAERYRPQDDENLYVDFGYFGALKSRPAKLLLIATKWGDGLAVSLELKVVDERGKIISTAAAGLDATGNDVQKEDQAETQVVAKPITLSKESLEIATIRTGVVRQPGTQMTDALRSKLMNPEASDPLAFAPSEAILGLAESEAKNVVACIPDRAFDVVLSATSVTPKLIRNLLTATDTLDIQSDGTWMICTPTWPQLSRDTRVSRSGLGQLVRELDRPGSGSLEPLAKFASQTTGSSPANLVVAYIGLLHPAVASSLDTSSWELMRFYAGLSPTQKAGGERLIVPYNALDLKAKSALTRLIFFSSNSMPMGAFQTAAMSEEAGGQVETDPFESISSEPTEAMPNGLPDGAKLMLDRSNATVAIAANGVGYTAEDLGTQLAMRERPELFPYVSESPLPPRYVLTQRNSLLITLGFNLEPVASYMLNDYRRGDGKWLSTNEFPSSFKDGVEQARTQAREAFKGMPTTGTGTGTGSNIPPR